VVTTASVLLAFGDYRMVFGSVGGLLLSVRRKANAGEKKSNTIIFFISLVPFVRQLNDFS